MAVVYTHLNEKSYHPSNVQSVNRGMVRLVLLTIRKNQLPITLFTVTILLIKCLSPVFSGANQCEECRVKLWL